MFAAVFYGVTVVQTLFYFQTYPNDKITLKLLVTVVWILDTLDIIFAAHGTYNWLIIDFANPLALNDVIWTIASEPLCTSTIALIAHLFMAYRIYILNRKLVLLALVIAVVSFVPFGVAITAVVFGLTTPGGFAALNVKLHSTTIVANIFTTSLDVVIAGTLVALLRMHSSQVSMKRTDKMISTLTGYLITNNLLTSFITTALTIGFFAAPKTLVYEALNLSVSKAYTNTFLSQLNARQSIHGQGVTSTHTGGSTTLRSAKFNLRQISAKNTELDFEAADPVTMSSSFGETVQNHSSSGSTRDEKASYPKAL